MCEKRLFREINEAFGELNREVDEIELKHVNYLFEDSKLEIVDYMQYFGISIDREYNESKGYHKQTKTKEDYMALIP
jgi:hypothetical protein